MITSALSKRNERIPNVLPAKIHVRPTQSHLVGIRANLSGRHHQRDAAGSRYVTNSHACSMLQFL
jgi:hypothetical protein